MQVSVSATRLETLSENRSHQFFQRRKSGAMLVGAPLKFKLVSGMNFRDFSQTGSSATRRALCGCA
jgi:hypothetical protein